VNWFKDLVTTYGLEAGLTAACAAALKWLRPRRFLSFIAAVREREDMLAASEYWEQEADRRGIRLTECRAERDSLDQEVTHLRSKLRDAGSR
jgi:hypothetical protein